MSETLNKLAQGGSGLPCCGLASVALITQTPLPIIYLHYKAKHNKDKQWRGATNLNNCLAMLKDYQIEFDHVSRKDMTKGYTIENYVLANPSLYALIRTRGHIQTILGEHIHDQGGVKHISSHALKNKYVCDVITIKGCTMGFVPLPYRQLLLINDGVCRTMEEAAQLYNLYGKEVLA